MKKIHTSLMVLVFGLIAITNFGCSDGQRGSALGHGDYKLVEVSISSSDQVQQLAEKGVDIWEVAGDHVIACVSSTEMGEIRGLNFQLEVIHDSIDGYLAAIQSSSPSALRTEDSEYHSYEEMRTEIYELGAFFADIARIQVIGHSIEGREIPLIEISDNPGTAEGEPGMLFLGGQHAREWIAVEVPLRLARYLCENYRTDGYIRTLVDSAVIWVVPMVNPDGHEYSRTTDRLWRKNRRPLGAGVYGVDLNRNYAYEWGANELVPKRSDFYPGPYPFSEPESCAIRDFVQGHSLELNAVVDFHSYGKQVLFPWGFTSGQAYQPFLDEMADQMARIASNVYYNREIVYTPLQVGRGLYLARGGLIDWAFGESFVPAFAIELRPSNLLDGGFLLPEEQIEPTFLENKEACLYLLEWAVELGRGDSIVDDFEDPSSLEHWSIISGEGQLTRPFDSEIGSYVLKTQTNNWQFAVEKRLPGISTRFLSLFLKGEAEFSLCLNVTSSDSQEYWLNYKPAEIGHPTMTDAQIVYSVGEKLKDGKYHLFIRNLDEDIFKVTGKRLSSLNAIRIYGSLSADAIRTWDFSKRYEDIAGGFPLDWLDLFTTGWDFQCGEFTHFQGLAKPLRAFETPDGPVYEYFGTGKFLISEGGPHPSDFPVPSDSEFHLAYTLFGFLRLDKDGYLIQTTPRAQVGFDVAGYREPIYKFIMYETGVADPRGGSGSLWFDIGHTEIPCPSEYAIYASGTDYEGIVISFEGKAYYAFHEEDEDVDHYLVEGTISTILEGSSVSPEKRCGTLRYYRSSASYSLRLESQALTLPLGEEEWTRIEIW